MNHGTALAQFGTFDVENYGDILYPIIFKRMLAQRDGIGKISQFSLRGSSNLQGAGYQTRPVGELFSAGLESPRTLIVGGGDLLRTDWNVMASHYCSIPSRENKGASLRTWRRWFGNFLKQPPNREEEFSRRYMNYPAAGPFIIEPGVCPNVESVAYCSCGVPFTFDEALKVSGAFDQAAFIYLRDHASKNALIRAGVTKEIHVGPDLIVALSDFFDVSAERKKGREIFQARGVNLNRRILVFQSNPQPPEKTAEIVQELKAYQERAGCEVVLLPLGWCHGDREYLKQLAHESGGAFRYVEVHSVFDILAALAASDVFLGTSLHGNITAFSFGIPHLFGPIPVAKREGFLDIVDLPADLKLESWAEIHPKLDQAVALGGDFFKTRAVAAKRRVHEVFDELFREVCPRRAPISVEGQLAYG